MEKRIARFSFPLLALVWMLSVCASAQHAWPPVGEASTDYYINNRERPKPDGLHYRTFENGHIYYSGEFENGAPKPGTEFFWYDYDKDGVVREIHLIGDTPATITGHKYDLDGTMRAEGRYVHRQKSGIWKFYDEAGRLRSTQDFQRDLPNGTCKTYYPSGKLYKEETFVDSLQQGPFTEYYERGKVKSQGNYAAGQLDGKYELKYPSGVSEVRGNYKTGLKDGTWMKFHADGSLEISALYKAGEKVTEKRHNGGFLNYFESGIPSDSLSYEEGVLNGPFVEYYDVGKWIREPIDSDAPGIPLEYRERLIGRMVKREGDYLDGKLDGEVTFYNENGQRIRIENYVEGELVETEEF